MKRSTRVIAILVLSAIPIFAFAQRAAVGGRFQVVIGGTALAVRSVQGGEPTSDVVSEKLGPDQIVHKHLAGVRYDEIAFDGNLDSSSTIVRNALSNKRTRYDGSIDEADYEGNILRSRTFNQALVTEIGFPALDGASKNAGYLSIKLRPEVTRQAKGAGTIKAGPGAGPGAKQSAFQVSNFRFEIAGVDCTRVNKIEAFTVKQTVHEDAIGEVRDYQREAAGLEFPNIRLRVSGQTADSFQAWLDDFVVRGNNEQGREKTGSLTFLAADRQSELLKLDFFNVGIFKVARAAADDADRDRLVEYDVELYVENMRVH